MSRCAFPSLILKLAIPFPDINLPKIPALPPIPNFMLKFKFILPRFLLLLKLAIPFPDINIPKIPALPPIPRIKLPGRPNLSLKLAIPYPDINIPKIPSLPTLSCPLDVKAA